MLNCDQYLTPESLRQALQLLAQAPEGSRLLAGATDTLPWARQGRAGDVSGDVHVPWIIDISRISELKGYSIDAGRVRIGAMLVLQTFLEDPELREHLPAMPYCAIWFADDQIRRQATLVGNLVNASPAADGTPPMLALQATVEIASLAGSRVEKRRVALEDFVTGPGRTLLQRGDIVTAVECDSAAGYGGSFEKVGQRRSLVISVACAACYIKPSAGHDRFEDVRLALGGIGPVPVRLRKVEDFLRGKPIDADVIAAAAALPGDRVASRTRREYRREVVRGFTQRALIDALADCGIPVESPRETAHA
jgi:carbon-monoxide dehydrogenase medium subunit/xanthine dehydrogenase FAD-binding subunit